jgi:hypothetical protein
MFYKQQQLISSNRSQRLPPSEKERETAVQEPAAARQQLFSPAFSYLPHKQTTHISGGIA